MCALERRAVIDIGSNSVKLLIADVEAGDAVPVDEMGEQTRLAQGLRVTGELSTDAIDRTLAVCSRWMEVARASGAIRFRALATSAVRDAANSSVLLDRLKERTGARPMVIDGDREACWAYEGVVDPLASRRTLVIDVGGGSVEFAWGRGRELNRWQSLKLGVVRLLEGGAYSDPPTEKQRRETEARISQCLDENMATDFESELIASDAMDCVAVGGSAAILANIKNGWAIFERERIDLARIDRSEMADLSDRLWGLGLEDRRRVVGVPPERADVILMAACLFETLMDRWKIGILRPSTRGLRFGAAVDEVGPWFPVQEEA